VRHARSLVIASLGLVLAACANAPEEPYTDHDQPEDFEVVEKIAFDRNLLLDDDLLLAANAVSAADVQRFLEHTPYGTTSFLARERVGGQSAAEAIVDGARSEGINPIIMLARLQVESSLIGKESRPSSHLVDYAFGCGCPDGSACSSAYKGLGRQIACAAHTLRKHYDGSVDGTSPFVKGHSGRTLDGYTVVPRSHATASLYSYTPWVLPNRGGNWLLWNITRRYTSAFEAQGIDPRGGGAVDPAADPPAADPPAVDPPAPRANPWIGDPCSTDADCAFGGGLTGACQRFGSFGMCTASCEGYCPDREGRGVTFCVASSWFGADDGGRCTRKAASENDFCAGMPGTVRVSADRFRGGSRAPAAEADVCVPGRLDTP
jgi:hypothetical protein